MLLLSLLLSFIIIVIVILIVVICCCCCIQYKKKTPLPSLKRPKKAMLQTFSRPIMDPDNINVNQSADITVGGVSFHLLSKFIFALQVGETFIHGRQESFKKTVYQAPPLTAVMSLLFWGRSCPLQFFVFRPNFLSLVLAMVA